MDEPISRREAIDALSRGEGCGNICRRALENLPSVQTEIIYCKDCLYNKICSWKNQGATFCSFGERGKEE